MSLDNELIAEFMGFKKDSAGLYLMHIHAAGRHSSLFRPDQISYHTSWDWLMPVVEKIESLGYSTCIAKNNTFGLWMNIMTPDKIVSTIGTKIEVVYKAVIEFIKWHNQNK